MIVYGLEAHLDHFWEFAVFVRFTYWSGIGPLTSLRYSLALVGSQTMLMDGPEAHLDHFWSLPFLCDLRIGVELAPKPA